MMKINLDKTYSYNELIEFVNLKSTFHKHTIMESERYGVGYLVRKMYFYPEKLPIRLFYPHGPSPFNELQSYIMESDYDFYSFFTKRHLDYFKSIRKDKSFLIQHPIVPYLKNNKVKAQSNSAIFFLHHSTHFVERNFDFDLLLEKLISLGIKDVSICLHYIDIQKGFHKFFIDKGFKVFSAGNWENKYFSLNLIDIISYHSIVVTNGLGSHLFYSTFLNRDVLFIEMEPVSITGSDPHLKPMKMTYPDNYFSMVRNFKNNIQDKGAKFEISSIELGYKNSSWLSFFLLLYWSAFTFYTKFYFKLMLKRFPYLQFGKR